METDDKKIAQLENEVRVLKKEVQAVLLDLRERYLDAENPFNAPAPPTVTTQQIIVDRQTPVPAAPVNAEPVDTRARKAAVGPETASSPAEEMTPEDEQDSGEATDTKETRPEAPYKGAKITRRLKIEPREAAPPAARDFGQRIDLVTIGGLARWVDKSVRKLGRQRTETILDISEMTGYLQPDLKEIMTKLVNTEGDGKTDSVTAREYLDSLVELTTLLGKNNETETALLSILSEEDDHR
jgi:hypothetical protein